MYKMEAVFSDGDYTEAVSSAESYLETIGHDEAAIAQTAVGLVNTLADKTIRKKYPAIQKSISRVWDTILHGNKSFASNIIEDEMKALAASMHLLQKMAECNYLGFELIAVLGNRLTMLAAMYEDSEQEVSEEKEEIFVQMDEILTSARMKVLSDEERSESNVVGTQLQEWKNRYLQQEFDSQMDLPVKKLLYMLLGFLREVGSNWNFQGLLVLEEVLAACGVKAILPITFQDVYTCLQMESLLGDELVDLMRSETPLDDLELSEYDIAVYSLLDNLKTLRMSGEKADRSTDDKEKSIETYVSNILGINPFVPLKAYSLLLECLYNLRLLLGQPKEQFCSESVKKESESEEYDIDLPELLELEKQDHSAEIQFMIGKCYFLGDGVSQDYEEAATWYRKAAEQGHADAQKNLATSYKLSLGVSQDDAEAVKWFRKAAEQGDADAQYLLASSLVLGEGVSQDVAEAVRWIWMAVEQEHAIAQNFLGDLYLQGIGVSQDDEEAAKWYRLAAEQGDADAQNSLGDLYWDGNGVPEDHEEAAKWYSLAAEQGNEHAQSILGLLYEYGDGVLQDYLEAVKWYRMVAELGNRQAQYQLGELYRNGKGVSQDYAEAVKWHRLAAEQGHEDAQYLLGLFYLKDGVLQDYAEAAKWFRMAAEQGHASAQYGLGKLYESGDGVPMDVKIARKYYKQAAAAGDDDAIEALERLNKTIGRKILGKAKKFSGLFSK